MQQLQLLRTGDRFAGLEAGDLSADERESVLRLAASVLESMVHTGKETGTIHLGSQSAGRLRNRCCDVRDCVEWNRRAGRRLPSPRSLYRRIGSHVEEGSGRVMLQWL